MRYPSAPAGGELWIATLVGNHRTRSHRLIRIGVALQRTHDTYGWASRQVSEGAGRVARGDEPNCVVLRTRGYHGSPDALAGV